MKKKIILKIINTFKASTCFLKQTNLNNLKTFDKNNIYLSCQFFYNLFNIMYETYNIKLNTFDSLHIFVCIKIDLIIKPL